MIREKSLFPQNINTEKDVFLGETSVQIKSFHDNYPSVHLVKSYYISEGEYEDSFYHIFEYKTGTAVTNYNKKEYDQVAQFVDVSDHWTIFYKDDHHLMPVSKEYRL
jgi:hypothetical protein